MPKPPRWEAVVKLYRNGRLYDQEWSGADYDSAAEAVYLAGNDIELRAQDYDQGMNHDTRKH